MRASVDGQIVAQSNDLVECQGYQYFPSETVRMELLEKAAKTDHDRACPHGVQFYDVVVAGKRHPRAAWSSRGAAAEDASGQGPLRLLGRRRGQIVPLV